MPKEKPAKQAVIRKGRILADFGGFSFDSLTFTRLDIRDVFAPTITPLRTKTLLLVQFNRYEGISLTTTNQQGYTLPLGHCLQHPV